MNRKENRNEMIFGCAYAALSGVGAMIFGGNEMHKAVRGAKQVSREGGGFVVTNDIRNRVVQVGENFQYTSEGSDIRERRFIGHSNSMNVVLVNGHENIVVSPTGRYRYTSSEVSGSPFVAMDRESKRARCVSRSRRVVKIIRAQGS